MEYTNRYNLPQYLVDWCLSDNYDYNNDPHTISATSLLKPVRVGILSKRHAGQAMTDVSELIASRLGNAIHDSVERIETENVDKETRVRRKVTVNGVEYTVTGKYDILETEEDGSKTIRDIKTTSVWSYIYGGKDDDYTKQMSIYKWLLDPDNTVNDVGYIDFFFTDWQGIKARTDGDYPQRRLMPGYAINLLQPNETEDRVIKKLEILQEFENTPDDELPRCTPDELWAEPDKWAVFKQGNKRATKVCDSAEQADSYKKEKKISGYIEHRPGKVKRCNYCSAQPFCNQSKDLIRAGMLDLINT